MSRAGLLASGRRIAPLAWPVFVGQIAVLAFGTVDTVLVARASALDLAALAIGAAAYISVFVGLMGVILAVGPIAGQFYGAGDLRGSGHVARQAVWLALGLSVPGCALLVFPDPFLALAQATPAVADKARGYLLALAFALPPALVFTAFRGFNVAVSRPKVVMALQLGGLALKIPLSALLVYGVDIDGPLGGLRIPALGVTGCGIATAMVMTGQLLAALVLVRRSAFYARFGLDRGDLGRPDRASLGPLLRLGLPMGAAIMIEVTGFTFMALFIARLGMTPVAGHQVAVNLVSMLFMMPLAIGHATSTLVAQRIGAGDPDDARGLGWAGLEIGVVIAAVVGGAVYLLRGSIVSLYTDNPVIVAAVLPLLAWMVLFHVADAAQTIAAFVLRAYRIATVPLFVYVAAVWGVGLGGGYLVAFDTSGIAPTWLHGARGFWAMATFGLTLAGLAMALYLGRVLRRQARGTAPVTVVTSG